MVNGKPPQGKKWQPGQSGNPGGRPKAIVAVALAARERTPDAIKTLTAIMKDKKATASARVSAAVALLERGWGKAPQTISLKRQTEMAGMTDDELIAIARGDSEAEDGSGVDAAAPGDPGQPH